MENYFLFKLYLQKLLLLLIFIQFSFIATAQNKDTKLSAELAIGSSFPIGKFANKNYGGNLFSNSDGLAKTGIGINLSFGYQLNKSIGAALLFGYSLHKQDANSFDSYLKNTFGANTSTSVETHNWQVFKAMAGGVWDGAIFSSK